RHPFDQMILATKRQTSGFGAEPQFKKRSFPPVRHAIWQDLLGREGANITLHQPGQDVQTGGSYGAEGSIYQDAAPLKSFDGMYPVIGSWVIGHEEGHAAGGMGIRESGMPIPTNASQFVPHLFD
ncbi:MAG: glutathionylspermidine synthase family protein, partial [Bryobacteraceae bacterium]